MGLVPLHESKPSLPSTGMLMWVFENEIARELGLKFILPI